MKKTLFAACMVALAGCQSFSTQPDAKQTLHYTCGTMPLTVTVDNKREEVSFILDGKPLTLKQQVAASGARYADDHYVFWSKGHGAYIERNDKIIIDDCQLNNG